MKDSIILGLLLGMIHGLCQPSSARTVVPNFTTGTVNSETTSSQTITESIHVIEYSTGGSYTVTGTNISIPGTPGPGTQYGIVTQGQAFQFSETYLPPGIASETFIERTTTTESFTTTLSVFTQ